MTTRSVTVSEVATIAVATLHFAFVKAIDFFDFIETVTTSAESETNSSKIIVPLSFNLLDFF